MPYVQLTTSASLDKQTEKTLNRELGQVIALFPGKSERWLMISLQGGAEMCFAGDADTPCAMLTVELFGTPDSTACGRFAEKATEVLHRVLGLSPDRVYVKFGGVSEWAWNGAMF